MGGRNYNYLSDLNIGMGTIFTGNTSAYSGGGIYIRESIATITGSVENPVLFENITANSCRGGICIIEGCTVDINHTNFIINYAKNFGGAVDIDNSKSTASSKGTNDVAIMDYCLINGNFCNSIGGGIAVEVHTGNLVVKNSIISNNIVGGNPHATNYRTADGSGGGIYFENA